MTFSTACSQGWRAAAAVPGVAALGDDAGVGERLLPRACERDDRVGAEADVGGSSVEAYPLRPGLGEAAGGGRFHKKAQAVPPASIAVAAGNVDGVDEGGGESLEIDILAVSLYCPTLSFYTYYPEIKTYAIPNIASE